MSTYTIIGAGVCVTALLGFCIVRFTGKPNSKRYVKKYEKDMVYLFQFPSTYRIACLSPYALKLETWLRLKKIPYKSLRTNTKWSSKGQIPFIELNGKQYADSNIILDMLTKYFDCEDSISDYEKGITRAVSAMVENQTVWSYFYYRYVTRARAFINSWIFIGSWRRAIIGTFFPAGFRKRAYAHGIGRFTDSEIAEIGKRDLTAISRILGDREFLLGSRMTSVDCCLFGHLAQVLYIPSVDYPHTEWVRIHCSNLERFCERMITHLWPEWDRFAELAQY